MQPTRSVSSEESAAFCWRSLSETAKTKYTPSTTWSVGQPPLVTRLLPDISLYLHLLLCVSNGGAPHRCPDPPAQPAGFELRTFG